MKIFSKIFTVTLFGSMIAIPAFLSYNGGIDPITEREASIVKQYQDCPKEQLDKNQKCKNYRNTSTRSRLGSRSYQRGK